MDYNKIEVKSLYKHYSDKNRVYEVFSNINFKIDENGLYGLKGESGSGKSTLIKILTRKLDFDEGSIDINNQDITSLSDDEWVGFKNKNISVMLQENYFDNFHTVEDNVKFLCNAEKLYYDNKTFLNLMNEFSVPNRKFLDLSKGEKQRALFIYTVLTAKSIIILDEPTSYLDEENANKIWSYLKKISKKHLIIVSSNKEFEIDKYCDKHIIIESKNTKIINNPNKKTFKVSINDENNLSYVDKNVFIHALEKLLFFYRKNIFFLLMLLVFIFGYFFFIGNSLDKIYDDNAKHIVYINNMEIDNEMLKDKMIDYSISYKNFYNGSIENNDIYHDYSETYAIYSFNKYDKELYYQGRKPESSNEIAISKKSRFKIGDTVSLNTTNGKYDLMVVGILEFNCMILDKKLVDEISNYTYIIDEMYLSFGSLHYSTYKIINGDIDNSKVLINAPSALINDKNNNIMYFKDTKKEIDLEINIDESLEVYEVLLGDEILEILLNDKNDSFISGRIAGYRSYIDLKNEFGNDYEIIYDYLNSDEIKVNSLNKTKLYEIILYIITLVVFFVTIRLFNRLIFKKTNFILFYNSLYIKRERNKIYLIERLVLLLVFLMVFGLLYLLFRNLYFIKTLNQSEMAHFYYITSLFCVSVVLFVSKGDEYA